jgi:hypothetical protein
LLGAEGGALLGETSPPPLVETRVGEMLGIKGVMGG